MENPHKAPVIILKVGDSVCCGAYKRNLREVLLRLDGVCSVKVDQECSLVKVRGTVDPTLLLKTIQETGKYADIIQHKRNSTSRNKNPDEEIKPSRDETVKCSHDTGKRGQRRKNTGNDGHRVEKEEEEHKCESYVPSEIDERVCRDFWCKDHKQRAVFHNTVAASASTGIFGDPFHGSRAPFHFSGDPLQQYGGYPGYDRRPMPPAAYGFRSGGYMPGSSGFFDHGHF